MDTLRPLVGEKPLVIFSRNNADAVSHSMIQLFTRYGANPVVYELNQLPNRREVENTLDQMMGQTPSVPAIFIGGNFIGGANDVIGLQVRGELVQKLIDARAIWFWNEGRADMMPQYGELLLELITGQSAAKEGTEVMQWIRERSNLSIHNMIHPALGISYTSKELTDLLT